MANNQRVKTRVISKHGKASEWAQATNFIPFLGEIIIYDADTSASPPQLLPRIKIGDGVNTVGALKFTDEDLNEKVQDELDSLITCGTVDPDNTLTSQFYFKYNP